MSIVSFKDTPHQSTSFNNSHLLRFLPPPNKVITNNQALWGIFRIQSRTQSMLMGINPIPHDLLSPPEGDVHILLPFTRLFTASTSSALSQWRSSLQHMKHQGTHANHISTITALIFKTSCSKLMEQCLEDPWDQREKEVARVSHHFLVSLSLSVSPLYKCLLRGWHFSVA